MCILYDTYSEILCTEMDHFFKSAIIVAMHLSSSRMIIHLSSFGSLWQNTWCAHLFYCCCPLCFFFILFFSAQFQCLSVPLLCFLCVFITVQNQNLNNDKTVKVWQQILRRDTFKKQWCWAFLSYALLLICNRGLQHELKRQCNSYKLAFCFKFLYVHFTEEKKTQTNHKVKWSHVGDLWIKADFSCCTPCFLLRPW